MFIGKNNNNLTALSKRSTALRLYGSTAGFTALEMLLVLGLIVLLLGAAVLVGFRDQGPKNRNAERRNEVNAISRALTQWSLDTGTYSPKDVPTIATCISGCNEVVALVRQDCSGYSNCFTTLSSWEAAYGGIQFGSCAAGDLVCAGKSAVAKIDGAWTSPNTNPLTIDGWTTGPNNYIKIYTTSDARHSGKWDTTKYRLEVNNTTAITSYEDYMIIDGLQILIDSSDGNYHSGIYARSISTGEARISSNIIRETNKIGGWSDYGIRFEWGGWNMRGKIWNNIIYDYPDGTGMYINGGHSTYNNTISNCGFGFWLASDWMGAIKNNIVQNCANAYYLNSGYWNSNSDYNISSIKGTCANYGGVCSYDTDCPAFDWCRSVAPGTHSQNFTNVSFVDAANKDFHIQPTDTKAKDKATDLSADTNLAVKGDIDSQVRTGNWDIGADEESASGVASSGCYDISSLTVPTYLSSVLIDPLVKSCPWGDTGYTIYKDGTTKEIIIGAPMAENMTNGEKIEARRK